MPRYQHQATRRLLEDGLRFYTLHQDVAAKTCLKRAAFGLGPPSEALIRAEALFSIALLNLQSKQTQLAEQVLWHMGFRYMLPITFLPDKEPLDEAMASSDIPFAKAQDKVLPHAWCERLLRCIGFNGSFWHTFGAMCPETAALPPFSFAVSLNDPVENGISDLLRLLQTQVAEHFPEVARARTAEIWWHCRGPHDVAGHPLHFDWDPYPPHARHSRVTSILYLTDCGAPTVVLDETCESEPAQFGILAFPRVGRVLHYESDRLHGVLPSLAVPRHSLGSGHRVTFMVAWWMEALTLKSGMQVEPLMKLGGSWLADVGRFDESEISISYAHELPLIPGWTSISQHSMEARMPPNLQNIASECSFHGNFFLPALRQPGTKWF